MNSETLRRYLEFYQDLGLKTLYRQPMAPVPQEPADSQPVAADSVSTSMKPAVPLLTLEPPGDTLQRILDDIGDCRRCRLCEGRNKIVFGVGSERAPLVFVGEGPGADEDEQG